MKNAHGSLYVLLLVLAVMVSAPGCGGGGGGGATEAPKTVTHTPVISLFTSTTPSSANVGDGGGVVTIVAYVDVSDKGGDVSTITIVKKDADTNDQLLSTTATASVVPPGSTIGFIAFTTEMSTTVTRSYLFEVSVTDVLGSHSNKLPRIFKV